MADSCNLYVIGEESENDSEDYDKNELFLRYNSSNVNESAMFAELGLTDDDAESAGSSKRHTANRKTDLRDSNFHNEMGRRRSSSIKPPSSATRRKSIFEPTYVMEPKTDQYFVWYKVRNLLNKIIAPLFDNFPYNSRAAGNFCKMVCHKSATAVRKKFDWPRYRYVCHVTLLQLNNQGVIVADRSLKFAETDNYAVCMFTRKDSIMIVTFYGIYQE